MNIRFNITVGILFVLAGSLLGSQYIIQFAKSASAQGPSVQPVTQTAQLASQPALVRTALPVSMSVPAVGVLVDVEPGTYNRVDQTWSLSDTKASFATVTSVPNAQSGNTFIYGHNRANIFAKLNNAKSGDKAYVTAADGVVFVYSLTSTRDAQPTDVSLFEYDGTPILTLQTCSGFWDQYRRLFTFTYEGQQ